MKITLKPDLRVETAIPLSADGIKARVGYVNGALEMRAEWGGLEADDESPREALLLQHLSFMARMMATILEQQREIEILTKVLQGRLEP